MAHLKLERLGEAALITLDRPAVLNAIDTAMLDAFDAALDEVEAGDARVLLLTGAGRPVCDAHAFAAGRVARMHALMLRLIDFRQPSIAVLNGLAYGGGLELALACTFRIAAPAAKLCMPEVKHGLLPAYGGTQLLPRLIGAGRALEMMLTGESIAAADALAIGLLTRVDADPIAGALALARRLPNGAGLALRMIRRGVAHGADLDLRAAFDLERSLALEVARSPEAAQGVRDFVTRERGAADRQGG